MAEIIYNRLFSVRLVHDFYESGFCNQDFEIVPWGDTEELMRNHNLFLKRDETGFRVYFKSTGLGSPYSFIAMADISLQFALKLTNPQKFLNITSLNKEERLYNSKKLIYFTNRYSLTTNTLSSELIDLIRPKVFDYSIMFEAYYFGSGMIVNILNHTGTNVTPGGANQIVPELPYYSADLTALPEGVYTFNTEDNGGSSYIVNERLLIDEKLAAENIEQAGYFGLIDIKVTDSLATSFPAIPGAPATPSINEPRIYDARFSRRTGTWRYYLVMKSGQYNITQSFKVEDTGSDQSPYTAGGNKLLFTTSSTPTKLGETDALVVNSNRSNIPFYEVPKKQMNLVLDSDPDVTLISGLPGPSTTSVSADQADSSISKIFIYI